MNHVPMGGGGGAGLGLVDLAVLAVALALAVGLGLGVLRARRGRHVRARALLGAGGLLVLAVGAAGPLGAHPSFTRHMVEHLLVGMVAPVLLVLAAPLGLALRALPVRAARALAGLLRSPVARIVTHPVIAAVVDMGGLVVLYTTPVFGVMMRHPLVALAVTAHVVAAGALFTYSIVGPGPHPHRSSFRLRAIVLIGALATHAALAKYLYGHPPTGVAAADGQAGAMVMYYGGDVVDLVLTTLLCLEWYRSAPPGPADVALRRRPRPALQRARR